jgi:hypothetical protein
MEHIEQNLPISIRNGTCPHTTVRAHDPEDNVSRRPALTISTPTVRTTPHWSRRHQIKGITAIKKPCTRRGKCVTVDHVQPDNMIRQLIRLPKLKRKHKRHITWRKKPRSIAVDRAI